MSADLVVVAVFGATDELYLFDPSGPSWTTKTLPAVDEWRSVATDGGGTWVVGGSDQVAVSDDDGATWSVVATGTNDDRFVVSWDGTRFVAADRSVFTSPDGSTWTERGHPSFGDSYGGTDGLVRWDADRWLAATWKGGNTAPAAQRSREQFVSDDITDASNGNWVQGSDWVGGGGVNNLNITPYSEYQNDRVRHRVVTNGTIMLGLDADLDSGSWSDDPDADSWTDFTHASGSGRLVCAAYNPVGDYWVAGGLDDTGDLGWAYSADGKDWDHFAEAGEGEWWLVDACWDGTYFWFAACGAPGNADFTEARLYRGEPVDPASGDITWTAYTLPGTTPTGAWAVNCWPNIAAWLPFPEAGAAGQHALVGPEQRRAPYAPAAQVPLTAPAITLYAAAGAAGVLALTGPTHAYHPYAEAGVLELTAPDAEAAITTMDATLDAVIEIDATCTATGQGVGRLRPATIDIDASVFIDPGDQQWTAKLVDADGTVLAHLPVAAVDPIVETLNGTPETSIAFAHGDPAIDRAAAIIEAASRLPDIEVQIWRGPTLWFFGPLCDDQGEGDARTITARGSSEHLARKVVGKLGGWPYIANGDFSAGLTGWRQLRATFAPGVGVGFAPLSPGMIDAGPTVNIPGGGHAAHFEMPDDNTDAVQIYQDIQIQTPAEREIRVRLEALFWIPSNGLFGVPNNYSPHEHRYGLLLTRLPIGQAPPFSYYTDNIDIASTVLGGEVPRDRWWLHTCEIVVPPGHWEYVHAAICAPKTGRMYVAKAKLTTDVGLDFYDSDPCRIPMTLTFHAQDADYGKDDVNIVPQPGESPNRIARSYPFPEHAGILDSIGEIARAGWCDWSEQPLSTRRLLRTHYPRKGTYKPRCRVFVRADGSANVAGLSRARNWSDGADGVEAQSTVGQNRFTEAAFLTGESALWERVETVEREAEPIELSQRAGELVAVAAHPEAVEVTCLPGDTRMLVGFQIGDTTDVSSAYDGLPLSGRWRCVAKTTDPATDQATFTLNPEPAS